jgi:hypothetical protein
LGGGSAVFEPGFLEALRTRVGVAALDTPVFLTDRLSDRVLAAWLGFRDESSAIAVNARLLADPEVLVHTLVEEFVHAWQVQQEVDLAAQRAAFAYAERPYEVEAKALATELVGYSPEPCGVLRARREPAGLLFDRPVGG